MTMHARRIADGPYRGRYIVWNDRDDMLSGKRPDGATWRRRPYYGHVWKDVRGNGRPWCAIVPGGYERSETVRFLSRREAIEHLEKVGRKA